MIDAAFINQRADPRLSVEIVQQFVQKMGVPNAPIFLSYDITARHGAAY